MGPEAGRGQWWEEGADDEGKADGLANDPRADLQPGASHEIQHEVDGSEQHLKSHLNIRQRLWRW